VSEDMGTREAATVTSATYGPHEHYGSLVLDMMFKLGCGGQGIGGICVDETSGPVMVAEVCALFGVKTLAETVGRNCHVLRCWPGWGETIEGIEVDGVRWTLSAFRKRRWPEKFQDRLTERTAQIQRSIDRKAEEIRRHVLELQSVEDGYVDWAGQSEGADK
jgi:hypothetical protein